MASNASELAAPRDGAVSAMCHGIGMRVLFPLPDRDFDVTEVTIPWRLLTDAGVECVFATEDGAVPVCDPLLLSGVLFGQLGAAREVITHYRDLERDRAFGAPLRWSDLAVADYDGFLLAGGHAPGMRQYLGSDVLQKKVAAFWRLDRPVAAICHGVLVLARASDPETGHSVLRGRRTTALPKYMERTAYFLTAWKLGRYYRTYEAYVEDEVRASLASPSDFVRGPRSLVAKGTADDDGAAFVVEDDRYVSGRWPGDAYLLARQLLRRLRARSGKGLTPRPSL